MTTMDWDEALASIDASNLPPTLSLLRGVSDAFGTADEEHADANLDDLEAALFDAIEHVDAHPQSPLAVSYNSSDDSQSDVRSVEMCSSSSDYDEPKKKRVVRKRTNAGLSAQEKRELRKLRNRELAAESRKRKNDEMDRLKAENSGLRLRVAELERQLAVATNSSVSMVSTGTKRTRAGTALATSVAVASMALFVVTGPSEHHGVGNSASVLLTTLDSFDGQFVDLAKIICTAVLAALSVCLLAVVASKKEAPLLRLSSWPTNVFSLRRMASSVALTNTV